MQIFIEKKKEGKKERQYVHGDANFLGIGNPLISCKH